MAGRNIVQRISLVGGDAIKSTFEALGKAGQDAFAKIANVQSADAAVNKLGASLSGLKSRMEAIKAAGSNLGGAFGGMTSAIGSVGERVGLLTGGGLVAAAKGFVNLAQSAGDSQEQLDNSAAAIGVSAEELDSWTKIAQLNGVEAGAFVKAMLKLNGAMRDNASADKTAAEAKRLLYSELQRGEISSTTYRVKLNEINKSAAEGKGALGKLGIEVKNADGSFRNTFGVFKEFGQGLRGVGDEVERSGMMLSTLGKKSAALITVSTMSAAALAEQRKEVERITPALKKAEREGLDTFSDRMKLLGGASESTRLKLAAVFAPSLTVMVNGAIEGVVNLREKYISVAQALEERFLPVAQDIAAVLAGKNQDVKDPAVLQWAESIKGAAKDIGTALVFVGSAISSLKGMLDGVGNMVEKVFGVKISGGAILATAALLRFTGILGVVTAGAKLLIAGVGLLVGVFGAVPVALVAAGVAIGYLVTKWVISVGGIGEITRRVVTGIPILFQKAFNGVIALVVWVGGKLAAGFAAVWGGIASTASAGWALLKSGAVATWDGVAGLASAAWQKITAGASALGSGLVAVWAVVTAGASTVWAGVVAVASAAWSAIVGGASALASGLAVVWSLITAGASALWTGFVAVASAAWSLVVAGASALAAGLAAVWAGITAGASALWSGMVATAQAAWAAVVAIWTTLTDALQAVWDGITGAAAALWQGIIDGVTNLWGSITAAFNAGLAALAAMFTAGLQPIIDGLKSVYDMAVRAAAAVASAMGGDTSGAQSNARGGPISGPGTGTSDSILSWLSNGEFVIKAAAVRKFGVGFFAQLNSLRNPLAGFANGGLASLAMSTMPTIPRFAAGGLVSSPNMGGGAPFTLQIGSDKFTGLTARQSTIDDLQRYASAQAVRSAGRKPSWYQG